MRAKLAVATVPWGALLYRINQRSIFGATVQNMEDRLLLVLEPFVGQLIAFVIVSDTFNRQAVLCGSYCHSSPQFWPSLAVTEYLVAFLQMR